MTVVHCSCPLRSHTLLFSRLTPTRGPREPISGFFFFHPDWEKDPCTSPSLRVRAAVGRGGRLPPTPTTAEMTRNQANSHVHLERSNRTHAYITGYTQNLSPVAHNNPYQTLPPDVNLGRGGDHVPQRAQHVPRAGSRPRGTGSPEQMHQPQNNTQPE